jgi:hypothetical protein
MNKTSGFREIEFKEIKCNFVQFVYEDTIENFNVTTCINGMLYIGKIPSNHTCKKCKGTGIVENAESKVE